MESSGPRWTSDGYCGQCGRKFYVGDPVERCRCSEGRTVTDLRYCVFCGSPVVSEMEHRCGNHDLRDFWMTNHVAAPKAAHKGERSDDKKQLPLL